VFVLHGSFCLGYFRLQHKRYLSYTLLFHSFCVFAFSNHSWGIKIKHTYTHNDSHEMFSQNFLFFFWITRNNKQGKEIHVYMWEKIEVFFSPLFLCFFNNLLVLLFEILNQKKISSSTINTHIHTHTYTHIHKPFIVACIVLSGC